MTERAEVPTHEAGFGPARTTWMTESVYFSDTVVKGNVVCYYGQPISGLPRVKLATRGNTSVCLGGSTWAKTAKWKVAGVVLAGTGVNNTGTIVTGGQASVIKESTQIDPWRIIMLGSTNPGYATEGVGGDYVRQGAFGYAYSGATAGDTYVNAYIMPWRF